MINETGIDRDPGTRVLTGYLGTGSRPGYPFRALAVSVTETIFDRNTQDTVHLTDVGSKKVYLIFYVLTLD